MLVKISFLSTYALHKTRTTTAVLAGSILAFAAPLLSAATWTWQSVDGAWNEPLKWRDDLAGNTVPVSALTTDLIFSGSGAASYTSTNTGIANPFLLNTLTLNSAASVIETISGDALEFRTNNTGAQINQNGTGGFTINNALAATDALTFGGAGNGLVSLNGAISGAGALAFGGGNWQLTNIANSFSGALSINTGSFVELVPAGAAPQNLSFAEGAGLLGASTLLIDGGTLKLTTKGNGNIALGGARPVTFGANGGILDITNGNVPGTQGGNIASGDLALTLDNTPGNVAVIKFNGGQLGLSSNAANNANWAIATTDNNLRISSFSGSGAVRFELTNGALLRGSNATGAGGDNTYTQAITYRGVIGGESTSGPAGTISSGTSLTTGRVFYDALRTTYAGGLTLEGALQMLNGNRATAIDGNITVASNGYVAFQGRGTGTNLNATIVSPGGNTNPGHNVLWIGEDSTTTLTVRGGGVAVFDGRIRNDQNNAHGILLAGNAVLEAGGTLRIQQSLSNYSALSPLTTTQNEGDIILRGTITGQGTTAAESILSVALPAPDPSGSIADGVPTPLDPSTAPAAGTRPFTGLIAESSHNLVVNGTGFGGLRVNAVARPDRLFSATGSPGGAAAPDPTPNVIKMDAYLTPQRLAAISGSGGYLTIAPVGGRFNFPAAGVWTDPDVGLKIVDNNSGGSSVSFAALAGWVKNLALEVGAMLDLGSATPFNFTGPQLHGKGTLFGTGSLVIGGSSTVSPGLGDIGTLTINSGVTLSGGLLTEVSPTSADRLVVGGNLTLGGPLTLSGTLAANQITIATYTGTLSGTFSSITGLPANFSIDYGTRNNSTIRLTNLSPTRVWNGNLSGVWDTTTANWQGASLFSQNEKALFDDTATGPNFAVTVTGADVRPTVVTVNNTTKGYTLTSSSGAAIAGPAQLIKTGSGILTLSGPATYTGGTQINAGQIRLGASNALPDAGPVTIASGATLNTQGNNDTLEVLNVDGAVTGSGVLTVNSLNLGSGASVSPNLVLSGDVAKTGAVSTTISGTINLGGASRTFTVAPGTTAPQLALNGALSNGSLTKAGDGVLLLGAANSLTGTTAVNAGTLKVGVAGALPDGSNLTIGATGTVDLNAVASTFATVDLSGTMKAGGRALSLTSLAGGLTGILDLAGGSLTVNQSNNSTYTGAINGTGTQVIKTGSGALTLGGVSNFDGGLMINNGRVNLTDPSAAGSGSITVPSGATLQFGATIANNVTLNGGGLSSQTGGSVGTGELNVVTTSTVETVDKNSNANSDLIFTGTLRGTGNLTFNPGSTQAAADGGSGFRLRGTTPSDYSGTVTVGQRAKFEIQIGSEADPNPFGTGKIVMTAGTSTGELLGTYSQVQPRLTAGGQTYHLANNIEISGAGYVNINVLGGSDVVAKFGDLKIGAGQILAANKNDLTIRSVEFTTVTLTGGTSEFRAFDPAFAVQTNANRSGSHIILDDINETAPGAAIVFKSSAPFTNTIAGVARHTGTTSIESGTLIVNGSITGAAGTKVNEGALAGTGSLTSVQVGDGVGAPSSAILAPGTDGVIGTLSTGNARFDFLDAALNLDLDTDALATDLLKVSGTLTLGLGVASLNAQNLGFGVLRNGEAFTIASATGGVTGTFTGLPENTSLNLNGTDFRIHYLPNAIVLGAVPEPGALLSLTCGLGLLLGLSRIPRREKRQ